MDLRKEYIEAVREEQARIREFEANNVERILMRLEPLKWEEWLKTAP